jgi:hypothetical protein
MMNMQCVNLDGLLEYELKFAKEHLKTSPQHLEFFELYGLDLRREYCGERCYARHNCVIAQVYIHDKKTD